MLEKLGGRKFILTVLGSLLLTIIPIAYVKVGVDSAITQMVLAAIAGAIGVYGAANVMQDKFLSNKSSQPEDQPKQ